MCWMLIFPVCRFVWRLLCHQITVIVVGYSGIHVRNGSNDAATATKGIDEALAWLHVR